MFLTIATAHAEPLTLQGGYYLNSDGSGVSAAVKAPVKRSDIQLRLDVNLEQDSLDRIDASLPVYEPFFKSTEEEKAALGAVELVAHYNRLLQTHEIGLKFHPYQVSGNGKITKALSGGIGVDAMALTFGKNRIGEQDLSFLIHPMTVHGYLEYNLGEKIGSIREEVVADVALSSSVKGGESQDAAMEVTNTLKFKNIAGSRFNAGHAFTAAGSSNDGNIDTDTKIATENRDKTYRQNMFFVEAAF